jgi:hypothetical protein
MIFQRVSFYLPVLGRYHNSLDNSSSLGNFDVDPPWSSADLIHICPATSCPPSFFPSGWDGGFGEAETLRDELNVEKFT